MNVDGQLLQLLQDIHVPFEDPHAPIDWKEWYHFVLIHPATATRVLGNLSLSGVPERGQVIVTLLVARSGATAGALERDRTFGFCADYEWRPGMVERGPVRIVGPEFHCRLEGGSSRFAARDRRQPIRLEIEGQARTTPLVIPEFTPFGSGFIGWGLVPRVEVRGVLEMDRERIAIGPDWYCYQDHNYGRFRWGEDIGWIWFVTRLHSPGGEPLTLVLHRGNNRHQTECGSPYLFVYLGDRMRKVFLGAGVRLEWRWTRDRRLPTRLPGAMASLFAGRTVRLPECLAVEAADEVDSISLDLEVGSLTEFVLADNRDRQYTFIEEMTGVARATSRIGGERYAGEGHFYAEFVY
jgi:hypothetical protein